PSRVPNFFLFFPTAMPRINPAKAWCFTLNNYTENELGALVQLFSTLTDKYFYIVGEEIGEQGTPHLQGYIEKKTGRFRPLPLFEVKRNNVQCMHFEKAKGNRTQNYKYCSKGQEICNQHLATCDDIPRGQRHLGRDQRPTNG
ncbi:replication protein, partial [uncultured marine virus]